MNNVTSFMIKLFLIISYFSISISPAYSQSPEITADVFKCDKIYKYSDSEGQRQVDKCLNKDNVSMLKQVELDKFEVLRMSDVSDLGLDIYEIEKIFSGKEFFLQIDGLCSGQCSRLIFPLARKVYLEDGAVIALTDSGLLTRGQHLSHSLLRQKNGNSQTGLEIKSNTMASIESDYDKTQVAAYLTEMELLAQSEVDLIHSNWHNYTLKSFAGSSGYLSCKRLTPFAVVLTPEYFRGNIIFYNKNYRLPRKDKIVETFDKAGLEKHNLMYIYEPKPFHGCGKL